MNWGPPLTSPIAHILSTLVFNLLSTAIAPLSVTFTPAKSKFNPSILGFLPVAINTASPLIFSSLLYNLLKYETVTSSLFSLNDVTLEFNIYNSAKILE